MESNYPAHIRMSTTGEKVVQSCQEHSKNTAKIASECLREVRLENSAFLAGLLHDMGKFKKEFRDYIWSHYDETIQISQEKVIHTFAGVRFLLEKYHADIAETDRDLTAELLAYAVGAHHGLFDLENESEENGFRHRVNAKEICYDESVVNFLKYCSTENEINDLFEKSVKEISDIVKKLMSIQEKKAEDDVDGAYEELYFYIGQISRLLLSAVINGDRTDTASFMENRPVTDYQAVLPDWKRILERMEIKLQKFPENSVIAKARSWISKQCRKFGEQDESLISLNVPTGGGKTLSALRFALVHASIHHKKRIIITAPLLTILEQNADVIREYVGDDSIILEHHSNVILDASTNEQEIDDNRDIFMENWNSPVIITTLVQLLNTFFSGKTSSIRRYQALCDSIIIVDEVQSVPQNILSLFNLTLNFLTEICNCTVVLCSATQPSLSEASHPLLKKPVPMVPENRKIWSSFKRTRILDGGKCRLEELPDKIIDILNQISSLLIVCNKKSESEFLYQQLAELSDWKCWHLSAAMCPKHRRNTLSELKKSLDGGERTICVSTQVIEAGVDISFEAVVRLSAGMDSIVQTAGRCNRNGEINGEAPVYVYQISDENLSMLKEIERAKESTIALFNEYRKRPEKLGDDLISESSIDFYYKHLYSRMERGYQDFVVRNKNMTLLDLLSCNQKFAKQDNQYNIKQAFKIAGQLFEVFDNKSMTVLVPYQEGREIIEQLLGENARYDLERKRELLVRAKQYAITIYDYQRKQLEKNKGIFWSEDGLFAYLAQEYYDEHMGFTKNKKMMDFLEV